MTPDQAARHLLHIYGNRADMYASDRQNSCRTDAQAAFWARVYEVLPRIRDEMRKVYTAIIL